jgi:dynein heavy chain 1
MFEVEHLRYATLATVSRCGMIWFSEDVIDPSMVYRHYLNKLLSVPLDADDADAADVLGRRSDILGAESSGSAHLATQVQIAGILERYFADGELVSSALEFAESIDQHHGLYDYPCASHPLFLSQQNCAKYHRIQYSTL